MFFSIVKILVAVIVVIGTLYLLLKAAGPSKKTSARDKLEDAEDSYEEAKELLTEAELDTIAEEERVKKELEENERLKQEVEKKKDIIN